MIALTPSLALTLFLHPVIGKLFWFIMEVLQVDFQLPKPDYEGKAHIYSGFRDKLSWAGKLRDALGYVSAQRKLELCRKT